MASIPQYHSDYTFCNELCEFFPPPSAAGNIGGGGAAMWADQALPFFFDNGGAVLDDMVVPPELDITSSLSMASFPERFGVSDMAVPVWPEYSMGLRDIAGSQSALDLAGSYQGVCELGEECNGFVPDFRTVYPSNSYDNWGFQVPQAPAMEEPNMQVGKYSVEERRDRILRYLKKRNQRNFNKTIKYACRKTLADKRVRVRGRFARNNELCEGEAVTKNNNINNNNPHDQDTEFYNDETVKIKHDEEDWLQEAMASLMYLSYIPG